MGSPPGKGVELTAVGKWLVANSLPDYVEAMEREGYDDLEDLTGLVSSGDKAFEALVAKEGHRKKMARLLLRDRRHSITSTAPGVDAASHCGSSSYTTAASNSPSASDATAFSTQPSLPLGGPLELGRFKVIVVGDAGTGKTSFIHRLVHSKFNASTKATIGVDWREKNVNVPGGHVAIQFWDISGQERFANVTRAYYQGAHGAIICYDRSNPASLSTVQKWKKDIDSKVFVGDDEDHIIPCVLVGTKCDLPDQRGLTEKEMDDTSAELGFVQHFETSAKTNQHILPSVEYLVESMQRNCDQSPSPMQCYVPPSDSARNSRRHSSMGLAAGAESFGINGAAGVSLQPKQRGAKRRCC